jgi:hypothetical protein
MPVDGAPSFMPMDGSSSGSAPWWQQLLNVGGQIATDVLYPSYPTGGTYYPPYTPPFSGGPGPSYYPQDPRFLTTATTTLPSAGMLLIGGALLLFLFLRKR